MDFDAMAMPAVFAALGTGFGILWLKLYFRYKGQFQEYIDYIKVQEKNTWLFPELFFIGFGFMDMFGWSLDTQFARKRASLYAELKGADNARSYCYMNFGAEFTYAVTFLPLGSLFAAIGGVGVIALLTILLAGALIVYLEYDLKDKVDKRREEIITDFPHILSKIALLVNAGVPLWETLEKVSRGGNGILYKELQDTLIEVHNGVPEYEAMRNLSDRCGIAEIRKFSTIINQNIKKGSSEMAASLIELSGTVWQERTSHVRQLGEKASAKLLLPIIMIFGGIMILVLVPILSSM